METLIAFSIATIVLALSPGPDNMYVLLLSMQRGAKSGIALILGLISGCIVHTSLIAFGVSGIIKTNPTAFSIIKYIGASYMFYLAYKVFRSKAIITIENTSIEVKSYQALFVQGIGMNVLNPKVALFFLSFFPVFLFHDSWSNVTQFYTLGFVFMLVSFIVFSSIAILASKLSEFISKNKFFPILIKWLQIVVFIVLGFSIIIL